MQWHLEGLVPGRSYELRYDGEPVAGGTADEAGELVWTTLMDDEPTSFEVRRAR